MNLKNYKIFIIIFAATFFSYFIFKRNVAQVDNSTLTIGTAAGYAPWVSINENGEYEGFDIDVMNSLAKKLNKKLIIKDLGSMAPLFLELEKNKIDAIIWGISITNDRLDKMSMVNYQGEVTKNFPLLFWGEIPNNIKTINDMSNKTVCVEPASSQDTVLSKYNFINKLPTEKVDDALLNLQYGKADAAFVEPAIAKKFKKKYPQINILEVDLEPCDQVQGTGICINKKNTDLVNEVTTAINELKQEGVIKELELKWGIE